MTPSKTTDVDYMDFLIAELCAFSCWEAERCSKYSSESPYHDSFRCFLEERIPHNIEVLWKDVSSLVSKEGGYLIIDDSTLDKPHARPMHLTGIHWSGPHDKMVQGISLVTLVWTNESVTYPIDFIIYHNDAMLKPKMIILLI